MCLLLLWLFLCCPMRVRSQDCCGIRESQGTVYFLVSRNETGCRDKCSYKKSTAPDIFCFRDSRRGSKQESGTSSISGTYETTTCEPWTTIKYTEYAAKIPTTATTEKTPLQRWNTQTEFSPPTATVPGTWGEPEMCPPLTYALGFQLKVAPLCTQRCKFDDDVALMGVRLYCGLPGFMATSIVTSHVVETVNTRHKLRKPGGSLEPKWFNTHNCPNGAVLKTARYRSEAFQQQEEVSSSSGTDCPSGVMCTIIPPSVDDPIGGGDLDMNCTDGTNLQGDGVEGADSIWLGWEGCPDGFGVCGIRSRYYNDESDKIHSLGQTQVTFYCCQLP